MILHAHVTLDGKEKHVNKVRCVLVISSNVRMRTSIRGPGTKPESLSNAYNLLYNLDMFSVFFSLSYSLSLSLSLSPPLSLSLSLYRK